MHSLAFYEKEVTNTKCQDAFNIKECNYDGGACCYTLNDDSECNECICHLDATRHPSYLLPNEVYDVKEMKGVDVANIETCRRLLGQDRYPFVLLDDTCDERANNRFCNYDNGACCKLLPTATL